MARIPIATYRLQFCPQFGFRDARMVLPYLERLGITDVYASPLLAAHPGSMHGYDVIDHSRLNPELGTDEEFAELAEELKRRQLGLLLDVVPNHMRVSTHLNRWWNDVLENGPSSPFAGFFDIDWAPPSPALAGKVLLPILADQYGRVLESGELRVAYEHGSFKLVYHDRQLPLAPKSWTHLLEPTLAAVKAAAAAEPPPEAAQLESILTALRYLPPRDEADPEKVRERAREKEIIKGRLGALVDESARLGDALAREVEAINGQPGVPASFDRLDALLTEQAFRVAYWRVAADEINYRRFFDINELAALRVENPDVFSAAHAVVHGLVQAGTVTGLRVDHVDGLFDPTGYLNALQALCQPPADSGDVKPAVEDGRSSYIVVEKILARGEPLPANWPVHGTTGYDFLNLVGGVFVDRAGARRLLEAYEAMTGLERGFDEVVYECKKLVLRHSMSSQVAMLARRLDRLSDQHRHSRDFTPQSLQDALIEVIACLPVYRTYLDPDGDALSEVDRGWIQQAVRSAKRRNAVMSESLFGFIQSVLVLDHPADLSVEHRAARRDFVLRLQQFTGGVMAKSVEDTAFYRFCPLASRGEVGGHPDDGGVSVDEWHQRNEERCRALPDSLLASSTHDTKRGEDVRARIRVVSEMPGRWIQAFDAFRTANSRHRVELADGVAPDLNEEYLLYQILLGAWPFEPLTEDRRAAFTRRIRNYMCKALREAKIHSSWLSPNGAWEEAVGLFVQAILRPGPDNTFLEAFEPLRREVARAGVCSSIAHTVLKMTAPGVPDFYQGTECWDLNLVDPDNRTPVDFQHRQELLASLDAGSGETAELAAHLLAEPEDGRIKMLVTTRVLAARRAHPPLFARGQYLPVGSKGSCARHIIAFGRVLGTEAVVVAVGRLFVRLGAVTTPPTGERVWGDTRIVLPAGVERGTFRDVITERRHTVEGRSAHLSAAALFAHLPVAVLERIG